MIHGLPTGLTTLRSFFFRLQSTSFGVIECLDETYQRMHAEKIES